MFCVAMFKPRQFYLKNLKIMLDKVPNKHYNKIIK